jgi:L-threonylcarbamoyladenylate synthase
MPTETVYGLAADALNPVAVARVFEVKGRPTFDPLIVHVSVADASLERLRARGVVGAWAASEGDGACAGGGGEAVAARLMAALWPGPLTLVLPKGDAVPDLVTSGLDTVAVRCPAHPVAQALLEASGLVLAAPSANRFGRISPTCAQDVIDELGDAVDAVLDGGPCAVGVESTIIAPSADGRLWLLRPGGVSVAAVEAAAGVPVYDARGASEPERPQAPGMLMSHYAPRKPLYRLPAPTLALSDHDLPDADAALLLFAEEDLPALAARYAALGRRAPALAALGPRGDWGRAAQRLFGTLRALDAGARPVLWVEASPPADDSASLALAVIDRLRRASTPAPG